MKREYPKGDGWNTYPELATELAERLPPGANVRAHYRSTEDGGLQMFVSENALAGVALEITLVSEDTRTDEQIYQFLADEIKDAIRERKSMP